MSTDTTDTRWMTYDELAAALGITPDSARRLVARRKWPRTQGNDGRARIGVPAERIPENPPALSPDSTPDAGDDDRADDGGDVTLIVNVLTQHIDRLEKELETVRGERDAEKARAGQLALLEAKHETLTTLLDMERRRAEEAQQRADKAVEDLKAERDRWAAQAERLALPAPQERRGLFGWLRRAG